MDRNKLAELREQRAEHYTAMRSMVEAMPEEGFTAEQEQEYERHEQAFDKADKAFQRAQRLADVEDAGRQSEARQLARPNTDPEDPEQREAHAAETRAERFEARMEAVVKAPSEDNLRSFVASPEYREAFVDAVLRGRKVPEYTRAISLVEEQRAALNLGTDTEGGITAPTEFVKELLEEQQVFGIIRTLASVFSTSHGRDLEWAQLVDRGTAGWATEMPAAGTNESEPVFGGPVTMSAHVATREIATSKDLVQDSVFDIEGLIRRVAAESFSLLENPTFVSGDGNGKPTGFLQNIPAGNVVTGAAGQTTSITTDDLIDVQHALPRPYRRNARWLLNDDSIKVIRKLLDANGQMIWQPGLTEGAPSRILGKPYDTEDDLPVMAASARSVVYADFSGYRIRDVLALGIQRLVDSAYARQRQIGYFCDKRVDGKLIEPQKFAAYENSAT